MSRTDALRIDLSLYRDARAVAEALAVQVGRQLQRAIESRGQATLVVSGGSTPQPLFEALARQSLDWSQVIVTLADERVAEPDSAARNDRMVRQCLLTAQAASARFMPLLDAQADDRQLPERLDALGTYDVVLLGMGSDGHTASLFPGAANLQQLLSDDAPACAPLKHSGLDPARISQSLRRLTDTRQLFLHTVGDNKWRTLQQALQQWPHAAVPTLPIVSAIERSPVPLQWFHGQRESS